MTSLALVPRWALQRRLPGSSRRPLPQPCCAVPSQAVGFGGLSTSCGSAFQAKRIIAAPTTVTLDPPGNTSPGNTDTACWWLLVRRHHDTGELAFHRCYAPETVPLRELVRVAGRRWTVEESFRAGKGLTGLDERQVRRWTSLAALDPARDDAHALLAAIAAHEHTDRPAPAGQPASGHNDLRLEY